MKIDKYSDVVDFLESQHVAVLSSVSPEGHSQSASIFFCIDDVVQFPNLTFYFLTRKSSRKCLNLMSNPRVSLVVGSTLQPYSVQMEGMAEVAETGNKLDDLVKYGKLVFSHLDLGLLYVGTYFPANPFPKIPGEDFVVFRIRPEWLRYMHPDEKLKTIHFTQILPKE